MKIPKHFVEQVRARASLYSFARSRVRFDPKRSKPERGEYWACCPFHSEKTPSFSINDRKGLYYCFGCGEKGNTISFVQKVANVSFPEAVRLLAAQEGMTVPAASPAEVEQEELGVRLFRVNELATKFFAEALNDAGGKEARQYLLEQRKLSPEIVQRFGLGYAPGTDNQLRAHLAKHGVAEADMLLAGLISKSDNSNEAPYDFFRHRIMFPIHRPGGDVIGFGGRALSPTARAKYLNTRDTPIFKKGEHLYWFGPACEAARQSGTIYIAEGYMDVIAMVSAGFENTVAPLGTALRIEQLQMVFGRVDQITVAFDGDAAGLSAASRTAENALAELRSGQQLRFSVLPSGQDPDDLLRERGATGLRELFDGARPLWGMLWDQASRHTKFDDPDSVAMLDKRINEICGRIQDRSLQSEYRQFLRDQMWRRKREERGVSQDGRRRPQGAGTSTMELQSTPIVSIPGDGAYLLAALECGILSALTRHPALMTDFVDALGEMQFVDAKLEELRREIVDAVIAERELTELRASVELQLADIRKRFQTVELIPYIRSPDGQEAEARRGVERMLSDHRLRTQDQEEVNLGMRLLNDGTAGDATDASLCRIRMERLQQDENLVVAESREELEELAAKEKLREIIQRNARKESTEA